MSTQYGTGHIHSLSGGVLAIAALSGYISPNLQGGSLSTTADDDEIKGQTGKVTGLIAENDMLECSFDFIPEGSTVANAKLAAGLPPLNSPVTITGLPVIAAAGYADAYNTAAGGPWFYKSGRINHLADGKWTATMTLKRYPAITSGTAIT